MSSPSTPKYVAIADDLKALCRSLPAGSQLPTEQVFAQEYGVSRMTIRHALHRLADEMEVVRIRGRGTFVRRLTITKDQALTSFTEDMAARGVVAATRLVALEEIEVPADVALDLLLSAHAPVTRVERLRFAGAEPICHETVHIPSKLAARLSAQAYETSLHQALRDLGKGPASATRRTLAAPVPSKVARMLEVPEQSPALRLVHAFQDSNGAPLYRADSYYRADRYELVTQVHRTEGQR